MINKVSETSKISILGFRETKIGDLNIFLEQFNAKKGEAAIQLFDATNIAGPQHLYFAAVNALNAFAKKTNISNNLEVEALLYASAQRQITKAVEMLGLKSETSEIAVLFVSENLVQKKDCIQLVSNFIPGKRDDNILTLTDKKVKNIKTMFEISELEFQACLKKEGTEKEALVDLIIERMALLVTKS